MVPVCFVLMSRRATVDYSRVLKAISKLLPSPPNVQEVMLDFEKAAWRAFQDVFHDPTVALVGCSFHWTKAVLGHFKTLGLTAREFQKNRLVQSTFREIMALYLLPAHAIPEQFEQIRTSEYSLNAESLYFLLMLFFFINIRVY